MTAILPQFVFLKCETHLLFSKTLRQHCFRLEMATIVGYLIPVGLEIFLVVISDLGELGGEAIEPNLKILLVLVGVALQDTVNLSLSRARTTFTSCSPS